MVQVTEFFDKACELDLEGIIAKRKESRYRVTEKPSPHWIKSRTGITVRPRAARNCSSGRKCGGFERLISGHARYLTFKNVTFRNTGIPGVLISQYLWTVDEPEGVPFVLSVNERALMASNDQSAPNNC